MDMPPPLMKMISLIEQESLNYDDDSARAARRQMIENNPIFYRRAGALAVHALAKIYHRPVVKRIKSPFESEGYSYVGSGAQSMAFKDENGDILKLIKASRFSSDEGRSLQAATLSELIAVNQKVHPDETVPTDVHSDFRLPTGKRTFVALAQPFVEGWPIEEAETDGRNLLRIFSERSLDEMRPDRVLPDVIGHNNLAFSLGTRGLRLHLLDTVPLEAGGSAYDQSEVVLTTWSRYRERK